MDDPEKPPDIPPEILAQARWIAPWIRPFTRGGLFMAALLAGGSNGFILKDEIGLAKTSAATSLTLVIVVVSFHILLLSYLMISSFITPHKK